MHDKKFLLQRRINFWTLLIGYIGYYLCRGNLPAAFPMLGREFNYTNEQLGFIAVSSELVYALGKFINGPMGDKLGGKKIFLLGMAGAIAFNIVFAFNSTLLGFIIAWCCARFFLSMGWGGLVKIIGHWYEPENHGKVMGLISISFQFGGVVASLFAGFLVSMGMGWREVFFYPAGVLFLVGIAASILLKDNPKDFRSSEPSLDSNEPAMSVSEVIRMLWGKSIFRHILVFSFVTTFLRSIFFFWTPKFLSDIGMSDSTAIFKSAAFPLLGCIGTYFLGWYTDKPENRSNRAGIVWICLLVAAISLLAIAQLVSSGLGGTWMTLLLLGVCGFCILGPYSLSSGVLTLDVAGARGAGSCAGLIDGVGYIGGSIAVWLTGILADKVGWGQVFVGLAVASVFAMISALQMRASLNKITA